MAETDSDTDLDARDRRSRSDQDDLHQTAEALETLAEVLGVQRPAVPPPVDAGPIPALLAALAPIGRALGVAFVARAQGSDGDPVAAIAEASRVRFRRVRLRDDWWRHDGGPLLGVLAGNSKLQKPRPVALLPGGSGYRLSEPGLAQAVPVTAAVREQLAEEAVVFYRPLPAGSHGLLSLLRWGPAPWRRDVGWILGLLLLVTLLGMLIPVATRWIVDDVLPDGNPQPLLGVCLALVGVGIGQGLLLLAEGILSVRVQTGATVPLQAAVWDRLLRLGPGFFRRYAAGDLHQRAMLVDTIGRHLNGTVLRSLLGGALGLLNVVLMAAYAPRLALVGMVLGLLSVAVTAALALGIRRLALRMTLQEGQLLGFVVQLVQGIGRLRTAAAESRAFNQWAQRFAGQLRLLNGIRWREDVNKLVTMVLAGLSTLVLLALASGSGSGLSPGRFVAFLTAYGMFVASLSALSQTFVDVIDVLSREALLRPLLQEVPEDAPLCHGRPGRADPGPLGGEVALEQVHFRYHADGPLVLSDVTLTVRPGEFVAIVGPSGSGKSTLLRLLLGFERPEKGRVLYDGRNLDGLDLTAVRRQLGVVLQSSWILAGSLYENIEPGHPVPPEDVWAAARAAALAEEIEQMPMQLQTLVAAGGVNLSGGQRQRLLLARALVRRPRLLLLDEATSALDNPTQTRISENLRRCQVTRIVIAHRLSTIAQADRICVLDQGRIVQTGTFAELAAQEGLFRTLIERQS